MRVSPSASPGTVPSKAVGNKATSHQRKPLLGARPWARASYGLANQGVTPGSSKVAVMSHGDEGNAVAPRGEQLQDDASVESRVTVASSSLPSAVAAAAMEVEDESDDERVLGGLREERKVIDAVMFKQSFSLCRNCSLRSEGSTGYRRANGRKFRTSGCNCCMTP